MRKVRGCSDYCSDSVKPGVLFTCDEQFYKKNNLLKVKWICFLTIAVC